MYRNGTAGQLSRRRLIMHSSGRSGRAWNLMSVDVDQLETVAACRTVVFPEDIGLVEILVADPLLMEADGEAGEGFEYGQRVRRRELFHGLRERVSSDRRETK